MYTCARIHACVWQSTCIHTYTCVHRCMCVWVYKYTASCLTPSVPQPVHLFGWKMNSHACKRYIFCSYNIFDLLSLFQYKSFHMSVWKRRQKHLWFKILHLYWLFSSYIMTVKGLKQAEMQQITVYIYIYMLCSVSWVRKFCTLLTPSCCTYSSFLRLSSVLVMIFVKSEDRWLNSERSKSIKFNTKLILSTHTAPLPAHTLTQWHSHQPPQPPTTI